MERGMLKAQEAETMAAQGLFDSAGALFAACKVEFETAGCSDYAKMAEKKREVAIKHARKIFMRFFFPHGG